MAATQDFTVTLAPRDIAGPLSLVSGTRYTIQNIDPAARVFLRVQVSAPARTDRANIIQPLGAGAVSIDTGEGIWCWTDDEAGAAIVVNTAA